MGEINEHDDDDDDDNVAEVEKRSKNFQLLKLKCTNFMEVLCSETPTVHSYALRTLIRKMCNLFNGQIVEKFIYFPNGISAEIILNRKRFRLFSLFFVFRFFY